MIDVSALQEPERSWSAQAMTEELTNIGVTPVLDAKSHREADESEGPQTVPAIDPSHDAVLAMEIANQQYVTVYVPETHHPGEKKITTEEKDGKVVTTLKEYPSTTTGGFTYKVPVLQARFGLVRIPVEGTPASAYETIWTANVEITGERGTTLGEMAVESARKAVRQLGRDRVILPPKALHTAQR